MIRKQEATGKTVDEARAKACALLGVQADDLNVSYEVLEMPQKTGFLGLKTTPAKVRVSVEEPDAPTAPVVEEKIDFSNVQIEPLFADFVDFDTFSKSDFRAVKVKACEAVKKSKKLLKFTLDDGTGKDRTVASGIAKWYAPEDLVGKKVVVVANLKPAVLCGVESNGMILAADCSEDDVKVVFVDKSMPNGSKIR